MLITSYAPEKWDLMDRGIDRESGLPMCHVRRITEDSKVHVTVWRLVQRPNGWYNVGQFIPHFKGFRRASEKHGAKLSNSRTDLTLLSYAQTGHGNAYA